MSLDTINFETAHLKLWAVYDPCDVADITKFGKLPAEGLCIITLDFDEVVGCSEWMRSDRATFEHIVKLHNATIAE